MEKQKKIRILHIAQSAGGVERYLQMLLKYINRNRFENILLCSYDYEESAFSNLTDGFEQIDMGREINPRKDLSATFKIRKIIKKYRPDIVYTHSSKAGVIGRLADFAIKNVCLYNPHGWSFNMQCGKNKKCLYKLIEKICAPLCDGIICISDAEKKSAEENKICKSKKLHRIFNGIDIDKHLLLSDKNTLTKESLGIPENAFVVGTVGRISEQKSPDVFIQSAAAIKREIPESFFVMVGDGELREKIEKLAEENNLTDSLLITGWVDESMPYIKIFDVALLLSRWEGFGLVLPEYMIAEKPVIATNVDAIPDIIKHNDNGILVDKDNPEDVKSAVIKLYSDNELSDRLAKKAAVDVKDRFDVKRMASEHEALIEALIKK